MQGLCGTQLEKVCSYKVTKTSGRLQDALAAASHMTHLHCTCSRCAKGYAGFTMFQSPYCAANNLLPAQIT
jgi:hypothetical protein